MSSGFVSTAILKPGEVFHGDEKRLETEDVKRQTFRNLQASTGSLHDQLEARKQEKQDEYDSVTRMMRDGAVGGIDEEEAKHLNDLEARRQMQKNLARAQETSDVDSFRLARLSRTLVSVKPASDDEDNEDDNDRGGGGGTEGGASSSSSSSSGGGGGGGDGGGKGAAISAKSSGFPSTSTLVETKVTIKRGKRRVLSSGGGGGGTVVVSGEGAEETAKKAKVTKEEEEAAKPSGGAGGDDDDDDDNDDANPLAMLGGYGSGSDSD